jgi:chromosome transmission fidelity protein 1
VAKLGRETKTCPYYGSRHSIKSAEIIALPYNILFQKDARKSFSINLRNQIVIIDEAHNLIDTIAQIHSVEISDAHVSQATSQLETYINRYKRMFSAKNMLYLKQWISVLNGLSKLFTATKTEDTKFEMDKGKLVLSKWDEIL